MTAGSGGPLKVFVVAGEPSGDALGAKLMRALRTSRWNVRFAGVGGAGMEAEGLHSLFPMADIAVMGLLPVIRRLPTLINRIHRTAAAALEEAPDVVVLIDSPDFTHRVARTIRKAAPSIPIIDYVSPTVWAWRPGRARAMRAIFDHVLAVLPFEPAAHVRLGGPPCSYVGHPLIERFADLRPRPEDALQREFARNVLLLPGSRLSEVTRLMPLFGEAVARLSAEVPGVAFQLPVVPHVRDAVKAAIADWAVKPLLIEGEAGKWQAFRRARAALAASGTVTLELGLSGVPMVAAYRVSALEERIVRTVIQVSTVILPSLILDEKIVPELLQKDATGAAMAAHLTPLISGGPERDAQLAAFARLDRAMQVAHDSPSAAAAAIVLAYADAGRAAVIAV